MPIETGFGAMTTGKDVSIDFVLASGSTIRFGNVTAFDRKPMTKDITSDGIDGLPRFGVIPGGWELMLDVDREDDTADAWWALYEERYYNGETVQNVVVHETIQEVDGRISQYRYEGVALHFTDAGNARADKQIQMKLKGKASRRVKVQ